MYFKIALANVKKSFKDYAIYFLTLTLGVSIFYSFNSIESQKAFLDIQSQTASYIKVLTNVISYVSIFVSVILGGLVLYANNFLIKKRKKELGIYTTLGMSKMKISQILIIETLLVGMISLILGFLIGFIESQGLSLFTSKLFDIDMSGYKFLISTSAISKTIVYFGIMFLLVIIFNIFVISKYKIIDLLTSGRKNENIHVKNSVFYLMSFVLCLIFLTVAYKFVLGVGLDIYNIKFTLSIIFGVIGTVLFFFSLCGFTLFVVKKNKQVYFKGINIFTIKQLNSKINTNFLSMSVICLMLFITICVLSTGIGFKNAMQAGLEDTTPFDASAQMFVNEKEKVKNIEEALHNINFNLYDGENYVYYNTYGNDTQIIDVLNSNLSKKNQKELSKWKDIKLKIVKLSDYNAMRRMNNKEEIVLDNDEVIVTSNLEAIAPIINTFLDNNNNISISRKNYIIKNNKVIKDQFNTYLTKDNALTVVINDDKLPNDFKVQESDLNVNYSKQNREASEKKFYKLFSEYKNNNIKYDQGGFIIGQTKDSIYAESKGSTTVLLFVVIYIGIIFLISSITVLALQQLCDASDSINRYRSLKKIGVNEKMINKSIFNQILIYFSLPIILALIHSIVGIKVANNFISVYNKPNIGLSSIITGLILVLLYTAYFHATYIGYKNIVKTALKK